VTFTGNIDPAGVLKIGTIKQAESTTNALLEVFADTPSFILKAAWAIPQGTPPVNLETMFS